MEVQDKSYTARRVVVRGHVDNDGALMPADFKRERRRAFLRPGTTAGRGSPSGDGSALPEQRNLRGTGICNADAERSQRGKCAKSQPRPSACSSFGPTLRGNGNEPMRAPLSSRPRLPFDIGNLVAYLVKLEHDRGRVKRRCLTTPLPLRGSAGHGPRELGRPDGKAVGRAWVRRLSPHRCSRDADAPSGAGSDRQAGSIARRHPSSCPEGGRRSGAAPLRQDRAGLSRRPPTQRRARRPWARTTHGPWLR